MKNANLKICTIGKSITIEAIFDLNWPLRKKLFAGICFLTFKMSPPWGKINFENEPTWTLESPVNLDRRRGDEKGGRLRTDTQSVSH
jgi:hypothetical protein